MLLIKNFKNIFMIPELKRKLLFTFGILIVSRIGSFIPVIGVNVPLLGEYMKSASNLTGLLKYLDVFSGGTLEKATLFALGIGPYINASIMMQLLGMTIPSLEQLNKEGDFGRRVINQYTRYLTILLSIVYSSGFAVWLESQGLALYPGLLFKAVFVISMTTGCMLVTWLADQISLFGIGNGSSMIIFAGIVARFPSYVIKTKALVDAGSIELWQSLLMIVILVALCACIIFLEKGERKIPVQYSRRVVGQRIYGGQSSYIPFKINSSGVMPVIFATTVLGFPLTIATLLSRYSFFQTFVSWFSPTSFLYMLIEFLLIIFFSFVYTALIFKPEELAENIQKNGGFLPGIRPGKKTALFFNYILTRIGLVGSIYLALLAISPTLINVLFSIPMYIGGTSLLIVVGVALETASQIESYLIENRYEGFLSTGRIKNKLS